MLLRFAKTVFTLIVLVGLLFSSQMIGAAHLPLAVAATQEAAAVNHFLSPTFSASTVLPVLYDFESGMPSGYFADPGGQIAASVVTTNTLAQFGAEPNHVLAITVTAPRSWAGLQGFNLPAAQDWSGYDGVSFWFKGTNSGRTFLYAITQGAGAGLYQAAFTDDSADWKLVMLPWAAFKYREGASGSPTLSLVAVTAYFIQFSDNGGDTSFTGTFAIDQMRLFDTAGTDVYDFESGMPSGYFADPGGQIAASVVTTNTLAQFGAEPNHVLAVTVTAPRGWAGLQGFNLPAAQNWSGYDGVSFWFKGTNSGRTFLYAITQGAGAGLYQAAFTDDSADWKLVVLPWAAFKYREGASGSPTLNLVAVTAYFIQFSDNGGDTSFTGTFAIDQMRLFDTAGTDVYDFESGMPSGYFADPGGQIAASVVTTNTLAQFGAEPNHVLAVTVTAPRGWAGLQGFNLPAAQDWSGYDGVSFWFKGTNSGQTFLYAITQGAGAGLYQAAFTDDSADWKLVMLPWAAFKYREGASGSPTLSLVAVTAYFIQFSDNGGDTSFTSTFAIDQMMVYGPNGVYYLNALANPPGQSGPVWRPSKVTFASAAYAVNEDAGQAVIDVVLDVASTVPVTVSYATQGGTAIPDVDYTPVSGTLVFAPAVTVLTFTVPISNNLQYTAVKTVGLSISDVISGELGTISSAMLSILNTTPPPSTALIEDFESGLPTGRDPFGNQIGFSIWGSTYGNVGITLTTGTTGTVILPGGSAPNTALKVTSNVESWGGFTDAFKDENAWGSQDWSRYDGLRFWFYGANSGSQIQVEIFDNRQLGNTGDSAERFYQRFTDNFSGWKQISLPFALFQRRTDYQPSGAPADGLNLTDVSGFAFNLPAVSTTTVYYLDQVELYGDLAQHPATVRAGFAAYAYAANEGQPAAVKVTLNTAATLPVTVTCVLTDDSALLGIDYLGPVTRTLVFAPGTTAQTFTVTTFANSKVAPRRSLDMTLTEAVGAAVGYRAASPLVIMDTSISDPSMIDDFEYGLPATLKPGGNVTVSLTSVLSGTALTLPGQELLNTVLSVTYSLPAGLTAGADAVANAGGFTRTFPISQNWSAYNGLAFWVYGMNTGTPITVQLLDNRQPEPGPDGWKPVWSDEFTGAAGSAPDPANWNYDIGGGGWGNNEWEYYTDSRDNSALDGKGHLVITATTNTDPALTCASSPTGPNGMCYATSARLLTSGKQEFLYGRLEARIKIPKGQGIWPAFWMLGNDIGTVGWPTSGEIDIMENIGKPSEQNILYGTIHGPGYSGGSNIGSGPYALSSPLSEDFHVFAIEWEPTEIRWYVDDTNYFTATVADLPPNTDWVFDHPFFFLLNVAVGGNWPGYPDTTTQFPQTMQVDYVRVSQAPDTAERFEATFVDDFSGWKRVILPFSAFTRSAEQPLNAPNDGLTLSEVWGYSLELPAGSQGAFYLDEVQLAHLSTLYLPLVFRNH